MAVQDLTTLANVKAWLNINDTNADALLAPLITDASEFFAASCQRKAINQVAAIVEKRDGEYGQQRWSTFEFPVTAVASATVDGVAIAASPDGIQPGFSFDDDSIYLLGFNSLKGRGNVTFTYTGGYASGAVELGTIGRAVTILVASWFKRRQHRDIASQNLGTKANQSYVRDAIPPEVQIVIDRYSRCAIA